MSPICVGVSHHSADVALLERLTATEREVPALLGQLLAQPYVTEAVVLSTCNRIEVYAGVGGFHGGLAGVAGVLARRIGVHLNELAPHLYVHYEAAAVRHAFRVAAGLDSLVVGEAQILGQLRDAYGISVDHGAAGSVLHELMQQALRVGKRAQSETGIDRAGQSVVSAALDRLAAETAPIEGRSALVVGAGGMGALALATLRRAGAYPLHVTNRGFDRAAHLAAAHGASAVPFADLPSLLATVDLVVTATAAPQPLLTAADLIEVRTSRAPLLVCDLAVPRNVGPGVAELPWVTLVDIERLTKTLPERADVGVPAAERIVEAEVDTFLTWLRGQAAAPTVAALRARADTVVAAELERLVRRTDLTEAQLGEITTSVHRIVQRLLHQPSVRVRQLAAEPGGERYATALRELFDLQVPADVPVPSAAQPPAAMTTAPAPAAVATAPSAAPAAGAAMARVPAARALPAARADLDEASERAR